MELFSSGISRFNLNILIILGLTLFGGTLGGRFFQKIKVPQVVGYIVIGLLLGHSGIRLIDTQMLLILQPFSYFALGLIGFMIGGELNQETFRKYGRQFAAIMVFESLLSFLLVTLLIGIIGSLLFTSAAMTWATALLLGAIASTAAPAATTVLWEQKSRGPLTTTVFGIAALDDVMAIMLFTIASSVAAIILDVTRAGLPLIVGRAIYEIVGGVLLGGLSGFMLVRIIMHYRYRQKERVFVLMLGTTMFVLGVSMAINVSMLLAAMVMGAVVANGAPTTSRQLFDLVKDFTPPVFVLFFVFIGARVNVFSITPLMILLIALYLAGRMVGKMVGARAGAVLSGACGSVKKYLPLCLFSQAGVAVGLSLVAADYLGGKMGEAIVLVITVSTFIVQLLGPPCVKYAVIQAQEAGLNITEDDIIRITQVRELMDNHYPVISQDMPSSDVLAIFSQTPYTQYPVVDAGGKLAGVINIDGIKNSLQVERSDSKLSAADLTVPFKHSVRADAGLLETKRYMDNFHLGFLPVTDENEMVIGGFDRRKYKKFISAKLLDTQKISVA